MKAKTAKDYNCIGDALAGHEDRITGRKQAAKYDNPMTDLVNLIIAEVKAEAEINERRINQWANVDGSRYQKKNIGIGLNCIIRD